MGARSLSYESLDVASKCTFWVWALIVGEIVSKVSQDTSSFSSEGGRATG